MPDGLIRGFKGLADCAFESGSMVTIGAFDGLHRGHQALLRRIVEASNQPGLPTVAVTFEPLPREYFAPDQIPARLMSFREKFEGLRQLGIDYVLLLRFDANIQSMSAEDFVNQLFIRGLNARQVVVGDDFRFGNQGRGDFSMLREMMVTVGAQVIPTPSVTIDEQRVSSSLIREVLDAGDFSRAQRFLGRPYTIVGKVFYGKQLGRELGFPTANVQLRRRCTAMAGVYCVEVALDPPPMSAVLADEDDGELDVEGLWLPAVANVGTRPTVSRSKTVSLEVHLLDFDKDIYGRRIAVRFRKKIRDEQRFDGLDALKAQIACDKAEAIAYFS